jgi:hypothetical protein
MRGRDGAAIPARAARISARQRHMRARAGRRHRALSSRAAPEATIMKRSAALLSSFLLASSVAVAQVPPGWYVYGSFNPSRGRVGLFLSHPRDAGAPTPIDDLQGDLAVTGSASALYRESDGAVITGERSPTGASVDVHVIWLDGASVRLDASFSVGTGGPCCGEILQMDLLPDPIPITNGAQIVDGSTGWRCRRTGARGTSRPTSRRTSATSGRCRSTAGRPR